jgi:DNA-binding IclR family transcriptional regulator
MPPLDTSPRFQLALRLTALGVQAGFTFSLVLVAADIASQLAPSHQRAVCFGLAGGTASLLS